MKKTLLCLIPLMLACLHLSAQSSEEISAILQAEKATASQVSYLPALYAERITENDNEDAAFKVLQEEGLFAQNVSEDSVVTLAQVCYVYAKTLNIKGGLFYSLFPSPRYAFKEFKARGIIPSTIDPSTTISGRDSLNLFNSCLELLGELE